MFSLGLYETILIAVIAIICIKPADYGTFIRKIAKFIKKCDIMWKSLLNDIDIYKD